MILFYILLGYLLFRFVVGFVVPIFRTTRQVREQFSRMNQNQGQRPSGKAPDSTGSDPVTADASSTRRPDASGIGEYIDFEDVKP